jgi:hypothetical protein
VYVCVRERGRCRCMRSVETRSDDDETTDNDDDDERARTPRRVERRRAGLCACSGCERERRRVK